MNDFYHTGGVLQAVIKSLLMAPRYPCFVLQNAPFLKRGIFNSIAKVDKDRRTLLLGDRNQISHLQLELIDAIRCCHSAMIKING